MAYKLRSEDILKPGSDLKAFKLSDTENVKKLIEETILKQEEILKLKNVSQETLSTTITI